MEQLIQWLKCTSCMIVRVLVDLFVALHLDLRTSIGLNYLYSIFTVIVFGLLMHRLLSE